MPTWLFQFLNLTITILQLHWQWQIFKFWCLCVFQSFLWNLEALRNYIQNLTCVFILLYIQIYHCFFYFIFIFFKSFIFSNFFWFFSNFFQIFFQIYNFFLFFRFFFNFQVFCIYTRIDVFSNSTKYWFAIVIPKGETDLLKLVDIFWSLFRKRQTCWYASLSFWWHAFAHQETERTLQKGTFNASEHSHQQGIL